MLSEKKRNFIQLKDPFTKGVPCDEFFSFSLDPNAD